MNFEIYFLALFGLLLVCSRTSAYYNKNYTEYRLTIRDNAGYQWATQTGAQQWCSNYLSGSTLASVINSDVQKNIEQFTNDAMSTNYLGVNDIILNAQLEPTEWQWINGQRLTNAEVKGEMKESYLLYAYLLTTNYSLMASKPTDKRSYLCQYTGDTSNCTNGFQFIGRCYRKYDNPKATWFDARFKCQNEGGELAAFDYLTRDNFSTLNSSALYPTTSTDYWVGLRRLKWKWLDTGSEANYTNWEDGHPLDYNMKCICLGPRQPRKWTECACNQTHQFICLTALSQTSTVSSTTVSSSRTTPVASATYQSAASFSSSSATGSLASAVSSFSYMSSSKPYSVSGPSKNSENRLAVGLGVGLGVGVPLIGLVVVAVVLLIRKRKRNTSMHALVSVSPESPPIELHSEQEFSKQNGVYATVRQQKEGDQLYPTAAAEENPVVYATIKHVN